MALMVISFRAQATTVGRGASTGLHLAVVRGKIAVGKSYGIITIGERSKRGRVALAHRYSSPANSDSAWIQSISTVTDEIETRRWPGRVPLASAYPRTKSTIGHDDGLPRVTVSPRTVLSKVRFRARSSRYRHHHYVGLRIVDR